jgi:hypothetical protein
MIKARQALVKLAIESNYDRFKYFLRMSKLIKRKKYKNLHHGIVMSKYIICQSLKKIHCAVFSIAHPKYSNFGGILDARW